MQCVQPQSQNLRRTWLLVGLIVTASTGCPQRQAVPPTKPFAGQTITIAVPDGPARMIFERHGQIWARTQDARLQFVMPTEGPAAAGDIVVFNPARLGELVAAPRLERVPDAITASGSWAGIARIYRNKLLLWGETAYALPLVGDATFLIYRADILKAGGQAPPKTMAEYVELARRFAQERNKPSLPPHIIDDALDREFFTLAAAQEVHATTEEDLKKKKVGDAELRTRFGFLFDTTTGEPRLTQRGFVNALDLLQQSQPLRSSQSNLVEAFRRDEAVLGFGTLPDLAQLQPAANPGRYGVAPIPVGSSGERVPYIGPGGYIVGVVKDSAHQSAAWDLLTYLCSPEISLETIHDPTIGSAPFRTAHLIERREGWFNYGLNEADTERLREALTVAVDPRVINAPLRLRIPRQEEYRNSLLDGIRSAVTNQTDAKSAMDAINRGWQELDAQMPIEQRLTNYLRSVNLRP
jgi:ABC-type glycerol-3-phosphate transport system substrate-binding protein